MNDDLLTSELTKLYYAGLAKDKMDVEEEGVAVVEQDYKRAQAKIYYTKNGTGKH